MPKRAEEGRKPVDRAFVKLQAQKNEFERKMLMLQKEHNELSTKQKGAINKELAASKGDLDD